MTDAALVLPSAGPDPIPWDTALAAVLGYARGRRPLYFRAPNALTGRWVELPAFAYERFDVRARSVLPLGEPDILAAEGLHGRLDPDAWAAMKSLLDDVRPLAAAVVDRAAGRRFEDLEDDEFSVLAEPGTVGALLRQIGQVAQERPASGPSTCSPRCTTGRRSSCRCSSAPPGGSSPPRPRGRQRRRGGHPPRARRERRRVRLAPPGAGRARHHADRPPAARRPAVARRQPAPDARRRARPPARGRCPLRVTARRVTARPGRRGPRRRSREEWWHVRPIHHHARQPADPSTTRSPTSATR